MSENNESGKGLRRFVRDELVAGGMLAGAGAITGGLAGKAQAQIIDFVRFAYIGTQPTLGCMVELVERHPVFSDVLKSLEEICTNWDGENAIRDMPTLG